MYDFKLCYVRFVFNIRLFAGLNKPNCLGVVTVVYMFALHT